MNGNIRTCLSQTSSCFAHSDLWKRPKSGGCSGRSGRLWCDTLIIRPSVIDLQIVVNAPPYTRLSLSISLSPLWWPLLLRCRYRSSGACGGFAKEDVYENLPWSPSKKSLKDMKERAAIQCMKKTQWDYDTEAKYQSICAYVIEKEAGPLLLCGATTHKNLRGKLCFSFGRHAEVDIEATLSTVDALKALSEAPVSSKFLFFLTGARLWWKFALSEIFFFFWLGKRKKKHCSRGYS